MAGVRAGGGAGPGKAGQRERLGCGLPTKGEAGPRATQGGRGAGGEGAGGGEQEGWRED